MSIRPTRPRLTLLAACVAGALAGCYPPHGNPSFDIDAWAARSVIAKLRHDPQPLPRPLVIIGGWTDPGLSPAILAWRARRATGDDRVLPIDMAFVFTTEQARRRVIERVIDRFGTDAQGRPPEVDVVGFSMGGLVARYTALPPRPEVATDKDRGLPRLQIARLFTIATPHRGAQAATWPTLDAMVMDMRPGSSFLAYLDAAGDPDAPSTDGLPQPSAFEARLGFPVVAYGVNPDHIVGAANSSPTTRPPYWLDPPLITISPHLAVLDDPRIAADILLRLTGQPPLTT
ncbi:MAG: hypothetical protein AAF612_09880, partial [Planctomycetota bacterium]